MTGAPSFLWPVYCFRDDMREVTATFFEWTDAATFVNHPQDFSAERREYYIGDPQYDRREGGFHASLG